MHLLLEVLPDHPVHLHRAAPVHPLQEALVDHRVPHLLEALVDHQVALLLEVPVDHRVPPRPGLLLEVLPKARVPHHLAALADHRVPHLLEVHLEARVPHHPVAHQQAPVLHLLAAQVLCHHVAPVDHQVLFLVPDLPAAPALVHLAVLH